MKDFFRRLFHIYAGEERNALLFASLGFVWALAISCALKYADALFILHVGSDGLTITYAVTACIMMVLALFLLKALHIFSVHRIYMIFLTSSIIFYLFSYVWLTIGSGREFEFIWYVLSIFGSLFFSAGITCYWTFVDQYYHLQDAKRLYGLFNSSTFLGIAATGGIMRAGLLDFQSVILLVAALLIVAAYLVKKIANSIKPVYDEHAIESGGEQEENSFRFLVRAVAKSKFTLLLMCSSFLILVLQVITEYSYLSAFDSYFDPGTLVVNGEEEKASLTLFLGECVALVSLVNLVLGLFIHSRLLRRLGVSNIILLTPAILVFNFAGWTLSSHLLFPLIGFFVVEGLLYIVDDNNFTLLLNAVPLRLKNKIRLIAESFFEPVGMLVSSVLIEMVPFDSLILGLSLAVAALVVGVLLKQQYVKAIYLNLSENALPLQRTLQEWFTSLSSNKQKAAERRLLAFMHRGDETAQLLAASGLLKFGDAEVLNKLLHFAEQLSLEGKIRLLAQLKESHFATHTAVLKKLQEWLEQFQETQLKKEIYLYLASYGLITPEESYLCLENQDAALKGAALMALNRQWESLTPEEIARNQAVVDQHIDELLASPEEEEVCLAIRVLAQEALPRHVDMLLPFLSHDSLAVSRLAAHTISLAAVKSQEHTRLLIAQLALTSDTEMRQSCLHALGKSADLEDVKEIINICTQLRPNERRLVEVLVFQMGEASVPLLLTLTQDVTMHDRGRILAGKILGRLSLSTLHAHLHPVVQAEIERAYFYFYHHRVIQDQYPQLDLTLLCDALLSGFHSALDFIIQLLGVAGESEDSELLSRSLRSPNPKTRSQVVETLERTCAPTIFRALYPLIADLPQEEKMQAYLRGGRKVFTLTELLDKLSRSTIRTDQIIAIALPYRLDIPNWRETVKQQLRTREIIPYQFAYELLET